MYPNTDVPTGPESGIIGLGPGPGTSKVLVRTTEFSTGTLTSDGEDSTIEEDALTSDEEETEDSAKGSGDFRLYYIYCSTKITIYQFLIRIIVSGGGIGIGR